jgi:hypothetical protein
VAGHAPMFGWDQEFHIYLGLPKDVGSRAPAPIHLPLKFVKGGLGPLHTRAKNRDHDIVNFKSKCPKVVPRHLI